MRCWLAIGALALAGCAVQEAVDPAPLEAGRVGASIAWLRTSEVAVVDPDQGSVSFVDPTTLATKATVAVGEEPRALLEIASGKLFVTSRRTGEIVVIDEDTHAVEARASICAGPFGLAETVDRSAVVVACEWQGAVVRVDSSTLAATTIASGLRRPRAVATVGDSIFVPEYVGGDVVAIAPDGSRAAISLVPGEAPERPAITQMTANLAAAIIPAFGRIHVAHELVNHDGGSAEKVAEDYGTVSDGNPKINPAVSSLLPGARRAANADDPSVLYARFDGSRAFNGPVALASFGASYLLVANVSSGDVAVLDANATTSDARVVGSFGVGAGPSGVAVDPSGTVAFVDNAFDGSVSRLDLTSPFDATAPRYDTALTRVRDLPSPYSAAALEGRRIFHDATNRHVTPAGVVACSTCHPGGGDDGLVWFFHTPNIPLKRRRTPDLANAHTATAPFHWNGQFATMSDLVSSTITDLMAGDALLVDVDSVQAYVDEIVKPPLAPLGDAAAIARGRAVFTSSAAGCATCHAGVELTDDAMHAVLSPMSLSSDDLFPSANTPALHGLFLRAPYFHDGRATDLRDLLTREDARAHGGASKLSPAELNDLIDYLSSL